VHSSSSPKFKEEKEILENKRVEEEKEDRIHYFPFIK
jgi:hypothetical protein